MRIVRCPWNLAGTALISSAFLLLGQTFPMPVTNVSQLSAAASQNPASSCAIALEGVVLWTEASPVRFALSDTSGVEVVEVDHGLSLSAGSRVRLAGEAAILKTRSGYRLGPLGPVVDNDGIHPVVEKSGAAYLAPGWQPITLDWFNGVEGAALSVEWAGPGFARQPLPIELLRHVRTNAADSEPRPGLQAEAFEGAWPVLPDFEKLIPVKTVVTEGFDIRLRSRPENAAVRFTGLVKIPEPGLYTFWLASDDGSRLSIGRPTIRAAVLGEAALPPPIDVIPGQPLNHNLWARCEGKVAFAALQGGGMLVELQSGPGVLRVEIANAKGLDPRALLNQRVRLTGVCQQARTADGPTVAGSMLVRDQTSVELLDHARGGASQAAGLSEGQLPVLTSAAEVQRLKRDEAQRGYPVRLRGVVTCVFREHQAFTLQDASRGIYVVDFSASRPIQPEVGEFLEIEGVTDPSLFAPVVNARAVSSKGRGLAPGPVRPGWEQLINGSLDAQYIEIQGIVSAVQTNRMALRMQGGVVLVELRLEDFGATGLKPFENALVRIRGCLLASWDYVTHQVRPGEIRIYSASITVDAAAPADPFSTPAKTASELRLFDPQAGAFQRVRICGQVLHARGNDIFIHEAGQGVRVITREPVALKPGDLIEAVGFPNVSGPAAPILHETVARKIGSAAMPEPAAVEAANLLRPELDATRLRIEGMLIDARRADSEWLLELQSGIRTFLARVPDAAAPALAPGSRLELIGVYSAEKATRANEVAVASFELLLNNPGDIRVLAKPPWWTLERLLMIVGALGAGLAVAMLWVTQLRRKVEQRTTALSAEIRERQRVEHQRELEEERSRIARDLHDELGSGITEIGMLAARSRSALAVEERRAAYLEQMSARARELVTALDEIVWAMNPRHDSLASLISYFSLYADRFLGLAGIAWRLDEASGAGDQVVSSRVRHQLFLAFKEALNNVVRHSGATEVAIGIRAADGRLELRIADNGRGLPGTPNAQGMDGVENMRNRVQRLGGAFEAGAGAPSGTVLKFSLPTV